MKWTDVTLADVVVGEHEVLMCVNINKDTLEVTWIRLQNGVLVVGSLSRNIDIAHYLVYRDGKLIHDPRSSR